jgi:SAM-dependent methyltransferase
MAAWEEAYMTATAMRRTFQGVLQILEFNRRRYIFTLASVGAVLLAMPHLAPLLRADVIVFVTPAIFWTLSSLLVSHYVYDCFPLYDLTWLSRVLMRTPRRWVNIHCGFDETSPLLAAIFPDAAGTVIDNFDPGVMTEDSIRQARQGSHGAIGATHARPDNLGLEAESFDAAFCIFAAHELRHHADRVKLFKEAARVLEVGGEFVVIEHLRDWRNFLAFGPGFLHFFSRRAWRRAAAHAGLAPRSEFSRTPFVHVFILRRTL